MRKELKEDKTYFSYGKLRERIIHLARRYGLAVKEINAAYTSVIGMLKYATQFSLTKDVGSAWVIARRELRFSERLPKNYKTILVKIKKSPRCESGTVSESTNGRNSGTAGKVKTYPYNPWQMLRVAVLTALSPERLPKCLSPLKRLLVSGEVRKTLYGREVLLPEVGPMGVQIPPAGAMGTLNRRDTSSSALKPCNFVRFG